MIFFALRALEIADCAITPAIKLMGISGLLYSNAIEKLIFPLGLDHFLPCLPLPFVCLSAEITKKSLFNLASLHKSLVEPTISCNSSSSLDISIFASIFSLLKILNS